MGFFTLFLLALGLSSDAFAVSITNGMCYCKINKKNAFITAITFGVFQAIMPIIGFILGKTFSEIIHQFQHWVALFLLGAIGVNMIVDANKEEEPEVGCCCNTNIFTAKNLILQGIATSIDALAVGVGFAVMKMNIFLASFFIGIITFLCCSFGVQIGSKFGSILGVRAKFIGGIILILIGIKIFVEHQFL